MKRRKNKEQLIKELMKTAKFRHVPVCGYDTTEEFQFSRGACFEALRCIPKKHLKKFLSNELGGVEFRSTEYYYEVGKADKFLDLDVYSKKNDKWYLALLSTYDPKRDPLNW